MRLDSSGNLGIGSASPGYKLEVNGLAGVKASSANAVEFHLNNTNASARDWVLLSTGSSWAGGGQTGYFNIYDNTAGQQRLTIDSSGNVGIGATTVAGVDSRLRVVGGSDGNSGISMGCSATERPTLGFRVSDNSQRAKIELNDANGSGGDRLGLFAFSSGVLSEVMSLRGGGNVGIGTTSPSQLLTFGNATAGLGVGWGDTTGNYANIFAPYSASGLVLATGFQGSRSSDAYTSSYGGGAMYRSGIRLNAFGNGNIQFFTDGSSTVASGTAFTPTERMRITDAGNVGIGTTSPETALDVRVANASLRVYGTGATDTPQFQLRNGSQIWQQIVDGADSHKWKLKTGGGTTVLNCDPSAFGLAVTGALSATGKIDSTGGSGSAFTYSGGGGGLALINSSDTSNTRFIEFDKSTGSVIGSVTRVTTTDAVVYNTSSDGRLKENLRDFTDSGRLIDSLKPRVFDWKNSDENGKNVIGFIAQEEHAADPIFAHIGAVSVGDEDPETITKQWQRSDAALIPILVAELQSLRVRVATLESK